MEPSTSLIASRENQIVEEFSMFDDWMGRYEYLIDQGRDLPRIADEFRTDLYRVHGCQSQVWVRGESDGDRVFYTADSDAAITRGLIALLIRVLNGLPAHAIVEAELDFLDRVGLQEHLSPTRKNGLAGMIRLMKQYALSQLEACKN